MRNMLISVLCALFVFGSVVSAQPPEYQWSYGYSAGGMTSSAQTAFPIPGCGYLVAGSSCFGDIFNCVNYGLAARLDEAGDTLWVRVYGGANHDAFNSAILMGNGDYAFAGYTRSYGAGGTDFWWVRTNSDGDTVMTRTYGTVGDELCSSIIETGYQHHVMVGYGYGGMGTHDFYVVKVDGNGSVLWTHFFGGSNDDECKAVLETADRGLLLIGETESFGNGTMFNPDLWVIRLNENGDSLWSRTFGGTAADNIGDALLLEDGSFMVCGHSYSSVTLSNDAWLMKIDSNGDSLWQQFYGGSSAELATSIDITEDEGYVLGGATDAFASVRQFWLLKADSSGDSLWSMIYGDTLFEGNRLALDVNFTPDFGFVAAGWVDWFGGAGLHVFKAGYLNPAITEISDVGNDQGRQVHLRWHGVSYDAVCGGDPTILSYSVYRRIDQYLVDDPVRPPRGILDWPPGEWEYISTAPARGEEIYGVIAPTLADSSSEGIYWSTFFVSAETNDPLVYYDSQIDSGYSVDNLPPDEAVITAALSFLPGVVVVRWDEVTTGGGGQPEQNAIWYRVYGDTIPNFPISPSTLLTTTQDLSYNHTPTGDQFFFRVLVSDDH